MAIRQDRSRDLTHAHLEDIEYSNGLRRLFLRLNPPYRKAPQVHSVESRCTIDFDENDRVIGIVVHYIDGLEDL